MESRKEASPTLDATKLESAVTSVEGILRSIQQANVLVPQVYSVICLFGAIDYAQTGDIRKEIGVNNFDNLVSETVASQLPNLLRTAMQAHKAAQVTAPALDEASEMEKMQKISAVYSEFYRLSKLFLENYTEALWDVLPEEVSDVRRFAVEQLELMKEALLTTELRSVIIEYKQKVSSDPRSASAFYQPLQERWKSAYTQLLSERYAYPSALSAALVTLFDTTTRGNAPSRQYT